MNCPECGGPWDKITPCGTRNITCGLCKATWKYMGIVTKLPLIEEIKQ